MAREVSLKRLEAASPFISKRQDAASPQRIENRLEAASPCVSKRLEAASPRGEAASCRFMREVVANGRKITFRLERKPVKNLNLRICRDGRVFVSANRTVPYAEIERFVQRKFKYVLAAIRQFQDALRLKPQPKKYVSGETFFILGHGLRLKVSSAEQDSISSDEAYIYLAVRPPSDVDRKRRIVDRFMDRRCKAVFAEVLDEFYPLVGKYGVRRPELRIKTLKARWGSCLVQNGIVTLNRGLLRAPRCCIEYVVLHELCHFVHPNHSAQFYAFLSALMPDWKTRKQLLNLTMV